jgi:hypothetical protein
MSRRVHLVCACVCARWAGSERVYCWLLPVLIQIDDEFFFPSFFLPGACMVRGISWVGESDSVGGGGR